MTKKQQQKKPQREASPFNPYGWSQQTQEEIREIAQGGIIVPLQTVANPRDGSAVFQYNEAFVVPFAGWNPSKGVVHRAKILESVYKGSGKYYAYPENPKSLSEKEFSTDWRILTAIIHKVPVTDKKTGKKTILTILKETSGRRIIPLQKSLWFDKVQKLPGGEMVELKCRPLNRAMAGIPEDIEHVGRKILADSSRDQKALEKEMQAKKNMGLILLKSAEDKIEYYPAVNLLGIDRNEQITLNLIKDSYYKRILEIQRHDHPKTTTPEKLQSATTEARNLILHMLDVFGPFSWIEFEEVLFEQIQEENGAKKTGMFRGITCPCGKVNKVEEGVLITECWNCKKTFVFLPHEDTTFITTTANNACTFCGKDKGTNKVYCSLDCSRKARQKK